MSHVGGGGGYGQPVDCLEHYSAASMLCHTGRVQ